MSHIIDNVVQCLIHRLNFIIDMIVLEKKKLPAKTRQEKEKKILMFDTICNFG